MNVLGIVCSPRLGGNTEILVQQALAKAKEQGAETGLVTLSGKTISPCDACRSCVSTKTCRIQDDMQDIYPKLLEADGIIFGSPVFYWNVTAQAKALIDRTHLFREERRLRGKVAGIVITAARTGTASALSAFSNFITIQKMIMVGHAIGYGGQRKGGIRKDKRGMEEAQALGEIIVNYFKYHKA